VKYAGKAILALPFTFHSFNGLRHLAWDAGKCALSSLLALLLSVLLTTFLVRRCSHEC
jgi:succinate dehydrogenase/fumarate reductase cytochrome b subunit